MLLIFVFLDFISIFFIRYYNIVTINQIEYNLVCNIYYIYRKYVCMCNHNII